MGSSWKAWHRYRRNPSTDRAAFYCRGKGSNEPQNAKACTMGASTTKTAHTIVYRRLFGWPRVGPVSNSTKMRTSLLRCRQPHFDNHSKPIENARRFLGIAIFRIDFERKITTAPENLAAIAHQMMPRQRELFWPRDQF